MKLIRPPNNPFVLLSFPSANVKTKFAAICLRVGVETLLFRNTHLPRVPSFSIMPKTLNPPSPCLIVSRLLYQ